VPPFDAVLVIAFGGPQGPADVRPFLANVLRGRRVAPERVEEVAHHYDLFGGVSPIAALTERQAAGLRARLADRGTPLPVYVGMRNWHPYLPDTLERMSRDGVRRAIGFVAAAHRSYSGCTQYRENVAHARAQLQARGVADVEVSYVGDWHTDPGFIDANADRILAALRRLPADLRGDARIVFTAHSIPLSMANKYPYREQIHESAELVMRAVGPDFSRAGGAELKSGPTHELVYQSRSGRPEDPWLGPDVCDYLRAEKAKGLRAAVLCPIGFLCDHVEVLYDLDEEAAGVCRDIGLPMVRAEAVNDHPRFIDAMADAVLQTYRQYERARPLPVVALS
jgi:protoporphyrin/coproporphyrin ferrochelatase